VGLRTHIDAVIAVVDALDGPVVLVGHSGGGAIIHGVIDARPGRVARGIYVDSGPLADGGVINDELTADGDDIPLPPWEGFDEADLVGLDDGLRADFRARAVPQPRGVAVDRQKLYDLRRYAVPVTIIACEFPSSMLAVWIEQGDAHVSELGHILDVEYIDFPTGHWPQFSRPADLGAAIVTAVDRAR
jgi:pimeloyl-ACP methyl ester carboxylesterase